MTQNLPDRIGAILSWRGMNKTLLAFIAGVHRNTIDGYDRPEWNPTKQTLERIERAVGRFERLFGRR